MAGMERGTKGRRARRQFTDGFRAGAVRLVMDEGKPVSRGAEDLDLTPSALRAWVGRARADRSQGRPCSRALTRARVKTDHRVEAARRRRGHLVPLGPVALTAVAFGSAHSANRSSASWRTEDRKDRA